MKSTTLQVAPYRVASVYINNAPNRFAVITGRWGEPALATFDTEAPAVKFADRLNRLMPAGVPRYVRCYALPDDGGFDRFTVVFTGRAATISGNGSQPNHYPYVGLSGHGETKGQPCDTMRHGRPGWNWPPAMGRRCHLGKRVPFSEMPEDLRRVALADYREIWNLNP